MHGGLEVNGLLLDGLKAGLIDNACDVAVCVPAPYLAQCHAALDGSPIALGAQDVSEHAGGAYTGEVSASMLREVGCRYVIVGHSERRAYHGESSDAVGRKTCAALTACLVPIVCVGETLAERENGQTNAVVCEQLDAVLDAVALADLAKLVIAYEPVWAIGTGKTATPQMAQDVHAVLRERVAKRHAQTAAGIRILYGGSMKPDNAVQLLVMPDIDGGLIGGASLKATDFLAIVHAAT